MQSSSVKSSASASTDSQVRFCALSLGILALCLGLAGFVPALTPPAEVVSSGYGYGYLFGVFPTNYFHNAVAIVMGLLGIAAFTSLSGSIVFNQIFAVVHGAEAVLGLLPFTNTLFGTMPLFGNNIWLNLLLAVVAFYFGVRKADFSVFKGGVGASANSL